jgi:hypothetical protein
MERPRSIFGLVTHLARVRWQALSPRGRMLTVLATVGVLGVGAAGVQALGCGECCSSSSGCPMAARAHAQADAAEGETSPCHADR